jgi:uncharacterized protein
MYEQAVCVTAEETVLWHAPQHYEDIKRSDFDQIEHILTAQDVLLFGTGETGRFLPSALQQELAAKKLRFDIMPTSAACRTYNVLMAEGRRVAALLLPL